MPDQNSLLSASQTAFLSGLPDTKDNQTITGFDSFAPVQFCTPSFLGCKVCIGANVVGGFVTLTVSANTPVGGFGKSFKITNNISFTWNPVGIFKVEFKVTNFVKTAHSFSFKLAIKVCLKVPFFGWKCASYSHVFSIPTLLPKAHQAALTAKADDDGDDEQLSSMLLIHALLEKEQGCNCHDD